MNQIEAKPFSCKIGESETTLIAFLAYPNMLPAISIMAIDPIHQNFRVEFRLSLEQFAAHSLKSAPWMPVIDLAIKLFQERKLPQRLELLKTHEGEVQLIVENF